MVFYLDHYLLATILVIYKMISQKDKKNIQFPERMLASFIIIYNLYLFFVPMFPATSCYYLFL